MADFEGDKGCGPTHYACECFQRQLQQAQENLRWAREQAESDSRKLQQAQKDAAEQRARFSVPIVCLCGSTRFMDAFNEVGWQKTLDGEIVLSVGVSKYLPDDHGGEWCGEDVAQALDELYKRKIDLADYVLVLNVGGYIGDSTRSEIEYAESLGKRVDYLEPAPAEAQEEGD